MLIFLPRKSGSRKHLQCLVSLVAKKGQILSNSNIQEHVDRMTCASRKVFCVILNV